MANKKNKKTSEKEVTSKEETSACFCKTKRNLIKFFAGNVLAGLALILSIISLTISSGNKNIENWIDKNPQKVIDSLNKYVMELQQKEVEDRQLQVKETLPQVRKEMMSDRSIPYAGNVKGDVVIIEFFDYNCGHCKPSSKVVSQLIEQDKGVKVLLTELPIFGGPSTTAAKVTLTVKRMYPKKVYDVHKALMNGNARTEDGIYEAVKSVGLDVASIKDGMKKYSDELDEQLQKYREYAMKLGINGTPTFIIGDELIPGAINLDQMKEYVQKSRK